jgi:cytochrome oxidase Cu insertion factor (SCO1/SenC/PrrC family)
MEWLTMTKPMLRCAGLLGILTILVPMVVLACPVCFVESNDKGYFMSTLLLMAMPYTLIGTIGGWVFLRYRTAQGRPVWPAIQQQFRQLWAHLQIRAPSTQRLLWGGFAAVLITVMAAGVWSLFQRNGWTRPDAVTSGQNLPVYSVLPDFRLLERSGQPFGLSDLRGTVWVANLFFSHCTDSCPLETAAMVQLQAEFAGEPDFRPVSISVDPERDTPQVLIRYAERNGADPKRWLFLAGHKETIHRLAREGFKLGVEDSPMGRTPPGAPVNAPRPGERPEGPDATRPGANRSAGFGAVLRATLSPAVAWAHHGEGQGPIHSARFVLVDHQGRIRGYFASDESEALQRLRQAIVSLLQEG